jgi:hypothetical protein
MTDGKSAMHALVGVWSLAIRREPRPIVASYPSPGRRRLPGLLQSFWALDAETGKMHSFDLFEDEDAVRGLKSLLEASSADHARTGLSYDRLSIVEVKAWAAPRPRRRAEGESWRR